MANLVGHLPVSALFPFHLEYRKESEQDNRQDPNFQNNITRHY